MSLDSHLPLPHLVARTLGSLTTSFEREGAGRDGLPSVAMWLGLLRAIPAEGATARRDLPVSTRVSRRAVRQMVAAATRSGWLEGGPEASAQIRLTAAGRSAASAWPEIEARSEHRWAEQTSSDPAALRAALAGVVQRLDLELPHFPISYGTDLSVTGGRSRAAEPGPPRIPSHGDDWVPVVRGGDDTVSDLTLVPLLSQTLVAFMIDFEETSGAALVDAEGLARGFGAEVAAPLGDLPTSLGLKGNGKSRLERHAVVSVRSEPSGAGRVARLTPLGQGIAAGYAGVVVRVEDEWIQRFGTPTIASLRDSLASLLPSLDPDLPDALIASNVRS